MSAGDDQKVAMLVLRDEGVDWNDNRAKAMVDAFVAWTADLASRGALHDVEGLTREGKTVRRRGATLVIDGPYAEGREAVLGFVAVRVADVDEACRIAGESPYVALGGAMEVRMTSAFPKPTIAATSARASSGETGRDSPAVRVALAHIEAWSHHDWVKTRELLAPNVHAVVTSTAPGFAGGEFSGVDTYMERKVKGSQLVEPGSVRVLSTIGDDRSALIAITLRVGLGPGGAMVTMARSCLYAFDEHEKIKDERDQFFLLSQ